ncbi:MAG: hypothetical protein A2Y82_01630 [Candidatus Buchananbacteria bacterium RBG_13_36_9]|uniref:Uncharacterized protein n=1 Tax=Candidatus Buchananbacteria bacterium RBG_13_36_9 TaxID=1797530 RepID=A0A1G1XLT3_9BACT|nr:MAG: hypothetical protein A2Y82_01630 [Candidatus Buchananbacteria bacterium RBG_13_36_9]
MLRGYLIGKLEENKVKINGDEWKHLICPICSGTGIAQSYAGFSDTGARTTSATCQKCMGTGIKKPNNNEEEERSW